MRIIHTGDWHLGKNLEGFSRMEEQEAFLNDFVQIVIENNVDLVLIAGDIYDSSNPPARAEKMFYDTLKKLSSDGERISLVIAGNHDNPERLVAAGPLAKDHGIVMVGTPKTIIETGEYGKHKVVASGEGFVEMEINGEKIVVITVPFPSEKRLNEVIYGELDQEEEKLKSYSDKIYMLFDNLALNFRQDTINIVLSHIFAMGSEEAGSERSIQLGGSYIVEKECFPAEAQYIALGHVHKPQNVPGTHGKVRYSGSPIHYSKKEISFKKRIILIDAKAGVPCKIEERELKVYKPIEIWKCKSIQEAIERCEAEDDRNCWVYLEVETERYIREDEIKIMKEFKKDILEIIPKLIGILKEEEDAENLSELPFDQIFREFYEKERGVAPENELVELLMSIISEEGETNETN